MAQVKDDPVLKLRAGDIPSSRITLFIEDPISRKRIAVTRTLELGTAAPVEEVK